MLSLSSLWAENERCIAVFHEIPHPAMPPQLERRWARQFVSRIALIPSFFGAPGQINFRFPEAPEIDEDGGGGPPGVTWEVEVAAFPVLISHLIVVEKEISMLTWRPLAVNNHGFQIVVIGPKDVAKLAREQSEISRAAK